MSKALAHDRSGRRDRRRCSRCSPRCEAPGRLEENRCSRASTRSVSGAASSDTRSRSPRSSRRRPSAARSSELRSAPSVPRSRRLRSRSPSVAVIGAIGLAMDHGSLGNSASRDHAGKSRSVGCRRTEAGSTAPASASSSDWRSRRSSARRRPGSRSPARSLSGSPVGGFVVGATYGLVRSLPVLSTARVRDPGALRSLMRGIDRLGPRVTMATTSVQCAAVVATALIVVGLIVVGRIGAR